MTNIKRFDDLAENQYEQLSEIEKEFWHLIAGDWAKHEDDYPYVYHTSKDCVEIALKLMKKSFEAGQRGLDFDEFLKNV